MLPGKPAKNQSFPESKERNMYFTNFYLSRNLKLMKILDNYGILINMVGVAKWLRHWFVKPTCAGSNPVAHPLISKKIKI